VWGVIMRRGLGAGRRERSTRMFGAASRGQPYLGHPLAALGADTARPLLGPSFWSVVIRCSFPVSIVSDWQTEGSLALGIVARSQPGTPASAS
jgi:hypothetical protein